MDYHQGPIAVPIDDAENTDSDVVDVTNIADASSFLFDLIRTGCQCQTRHNNDGKSCKEIVEHAMNHKDEAFYISPDNGRSSLHEACLRNACRHILSALLHLHPLATMQCDSSGNTPLHLLFIDFVYTAINPDGTELRTVVDLLSANPSRIASKQNNEGSTALHIACLAPESVVKPSVLAGLIKANPTCATLANNRHQTPLSLYCGRRKTNPEVVRLLFDANPSAIGLLDYSGWNAAHYAANNGNTELICYLTSVSTPSENKIKTNPQGRTALHLLCKQSPRDIHLPAIKRLLDFNPESAVVPDSVNSSIPLHIACSCIRQSLSVIKALLKSNQNAVSMTDAEGYTALHRSCEMAADVEIIRFLLSMHRESASMKTRKRDTPLHIACSANSSAETVKLLIEANSNALTMTNDYGFSPLHCVCRAYQPKVGIVRALLEVSPACVKLQTHGGESPIHLACSSGAFISVLELLTQARNSISKNSYVFGDRQSDRRITNKVGNTPLHEACFRGASFDHIETLAKSNPEWIVAQNNAGYNPLQILCKGARLDEHVVNVFSKIKGHEVFAVSDTNGHTPLHSSCREGTKLEAIQSLIQAYPEALHMETAYGDLPLHLACLRGADVEVVCKIAEATSSSKRNSSPVLKPNCSGQTPLSISMDVYQSVCKGGAGFCCVSGNFSEDQQNAFDVLCALVKLSYYGEVFLSNDKPTNLVKACVSLHRKGNIRLDPTFIRRAIHVYPEEVRMADADGYPLHIEASIPIEKMTLLDSQIHVPGGGCCEGRCQSRMGVLGMLLESYPEATKVRAGHGYENKEGEFPLNLMSRNGRQWGRDFTLAMTTFPPALHYNDSFNSESILPFILTKISRDCGIETLYEIINSKPNIVIQRKKRSSRVAQEDGER